MVRFYLTRRAGLDLLEIEAFSLEKWGEVQTETYMDDLYRIFGKIAANPDIGRSRRDRVFPFYMASAKQHFAIYKPVDDGVIIATILHSRRNIEAIVSRMRVALAEEIKAMERKG